MTHPIHAVMTEHAPRPQGDPLYVPWWAKGEYARKNGTKYTTEEGSAIDAGRVVTEGHGRRSEPAPVSKYHPEPEKATETPRRPEGTPSRVIRTLPVTTDDQAAELVATYRDRKGREFLCRKYGLDPGILDAPNAGIQSMRLRNALRKVIR